jgi:hypothetical protein
MHSITVQETRTDDHLRLFHADNPLLLEILDVIGRVENIKEAARSFYFEVILFPHACPECGATLKMTGLSECSCFHGHVLDPTTTFQVSECCQVKLIRKTFHYACASCRRTVPSRFIFDERIFDKEYFREMMQESRRRKSIKREEIRRLLADSRSDVLSLIEYPDLEAIPGLIWDLDSFIQICGGQETPSFCDPMSDFKMDTYRRHILSLLGIQTLRFSDISPLTGDDRRDRVRRFITLVFMDNDLEVEIEQYGNDLLIQRRSNEAYAEG